MSISSLASQYISASFQPLIQYSSSGAIYDGFGNQITKISNIGITGSLLGSSSYALSASYALNSTSAGGADSTIQFNKGGTVLSGSIYFKYNYTNNSLNQGFNVTASAAYSHAEGYFTTASGQASHAEGYYSKATSQYSHAEGWNTLASALAAHSEGYFVSASGVSSHAEGAYTKASGQYAHAEGGFSTASGDYAHSQGYNTSAVGQYSFAGGNNTSATGDGSVAFGLSTLSSGTYSVAFGSLTEATGLYSVAFGYNTNATGLYSTVFGYGADATGPWSFAGGVNTTSNGTGSVAFGDYARASGYSSVAIGNSVTASYDMSVALNQGTRTNNAVMTAVGQFNNSSTGLFVVGNGTSSALSNAFRVSGSTTYTSGGTVSSGADYAEYFESIDGTKFPYGTVVELTGSKITVCTNPENAIGVISSKPAIIGNSDDGTSDEWIGKYQKNIWGEYILEAYTYMESNGYDELGNRLYKEVSGYRRVLNPDYDDSIPYIPRDRRPEWNVVGLLGQIKVLNNQQIPSSWKFIKSVNDEISIYLVK